MNIEYSSIKPETVVNFVIEIKTILKISVFLYFSQRKRLCEKAKLYAYGVSAGSDGQEIMRVHL